MPFTPEVAEQLKEWGLTPEETAQLEPILGKPERQEKIKGSALRQSEFSRRMQALDKQKSDAEADLAAKQAKVAQDATELGTWKTSADKTVQDNVKAAEEARVRAFRLEEKMKSLAAEQGVDPKEWGLTEGDVKPPDKKTDEPPKLDDRYLGKEDAKRLENELKSGPFIAAEIEDIVDEHRSLFGKGLSRKELVANALKNKRTLREEWEAANEVPKKREEIAEKKVNDRIEARVAEEKTKMLSEHKLPVSRGGDSGSPILGMRDQLTLTGKDRSAVNTETSAVDAAIQAHNTGRYKTAAPAKTA